MSTNDATGNRMKVALISLGCDKNLVDSEVMLGILAEKGYDLISDKSEADVLILNTCGFIADAVTESFQIAFELADYKEHGTCKALIVTGCMAQRYKDEVFEEIPGVDAVLGTGDYSKIADVLEKVLGGNNKEVMMSGIDCDIPEPDKAKRILSTPSHYAYIKVAEGCDNRCTYCTIPTLRGGFRSREMDVLIQEAKSLADQGVKELIVVAQDTSLYGIDLYGESKIHELINGFSKISGIEWIRLLYCYPEHITDALINEMAENPKVCHYIDMPIQHINNDVLKRMGRKSSKESTMSVISKLRAAMPDITLRTTLIAGFPGETQEEFDEMLQFVKETGFDKLGVFAYSKEEGTPAAKMPDQVPEREKIRRSKIVMREQQKISLKNHNEKVGNTYKVLVEGVLPENRRKYYGRSYMDCPDADGLVVIESNKRLDIGEFVDAIIKDASEYDLMGELVE